VGTQGSWLVACVLCAGGAAPGRAVGGVCGCV